MRSTISTHPDRGGVMPAAVFQNESNLGVQLMNIGASKVTLARYNEANPGNRRGLLDLNFAYDDGAVERFDAVQIDDHPRLRRVPQHGNDGAPAYREYIPAK